MSTREVPIVIITGYLGSGKTTLMQNILKQEQRKIALIVNDMGKALEIRRRLSAVNPSVYEPDVAWTLNNLALLYKDTQRYSDAEEM